MDIRNYKQLGAKPVALVTLGLATVTGALADTTAGGGSSMDYSTTIDAFTSSMATFFSTNGPKLLGALVVLLGFGIVWKLIKRAAKSV